MSESAGLDTRGPADIAVGSRVRVHPDTETEAQGVIVDDFGDTAGSAVDVGEHRIAEAGRRWAVAMDSGTLVFADTADLVAE